MADKLIKERLKAVREGLGINMAEASRRLELSKMGYLRYERGDREPSLQSIEFIAERFGTSVEYLTGKTDDPSPSKLVISKKADPELFDLILELRDEEGNTYDALVEILKQNKKKRCSDRGSLLLRKLKNI